MAKDALISVVALVVAAGLAYLGYRVLRFLSDIYDKY